MTARAAPAEALPADADAVARGAPSRLNKIEVALIGIDHDRARPLAPVILDIGAQIGRVDLIGVHRRHGKPLVVDFTVGRIERGIHGRYGRKRRVSPLGRDAACKDGGCPEDEKAAADLVHGVLQAATRTRAAKAGDGWATYREGNRRQEFSAEFSNTGGHAQVPSSPRRDPTKMMRCNGATLPFMPLSGMQARAIACPRTTYCKL